jgi:long-chain acyl-CoA synthetase
VVVPDRAAFDRWAEQNRVELGDLTRTPAVRDVIETEIRERAGEMRSYELPKRVLVVDEDFSTDNGLLTPTMKLKRRAVLQRYGTELEALYLEDEERPRIQA